MRTVKMKTCSAIGIILLTWVAVPRSYAVNLKATPSILFDEAWDSNVFNAPSNEKSDFIFRAKPKLMLSLEVFNTNLDLTGGFELEKYSKYTELDKNTATKNYGLTVNEPIQITPRFSLRPSIRYIETQDAVRRNKLTETPVPGLPPSETTVTTRTGVREYAASMQLAYLLTPLVDLEIGGGGTKREFTEKVTGLIDSRSVKGNASAKYRVTGRLSTGVYFDTSYNSFTGRPNSRTYTGGLLGTYRLTENNTLDARAGATLDRESTGVGDGKRDIWSPNGRLSFTYVRGEFSASVLGSYELAGAGSFGRTTKRTNAVVSLTDQFARGWWWLLSGYGQTNRSTDIAATEDLVSAGGTGGIRYMPVRWATLSLMGNTIRQWSHGLDGENLGRESVLLGVTLSDTYILF